MISTLLATSFSVNPPCSRLGAVHVDVEVRIIEVLLDAGPRCRARGESVIEHADGNFAIGVDVAPVDLNVDGRGQAEIQNLGHDVGRQKRESDARECCAAAFCEFRAT